MAKRNSKANAKAFVDMTWRGCCCGCGGVKMCSADPIRVQRVDEERAEAVAAAVAHLGETGSYRVAVSGDVYGRAEENSREMRLGAVDPGDVERLRDELKEAFSVHTAR
jgi:hypothetical protein